MSAGTAPPLSLDIVAGRDAPAGRPETASALSRREATLRSAATTCLAGIAVVQALGLPSLLVHGGRFAVLSLAAMALCLALSLALAAAPASASRQLWRAVAAAAALVLAGWGTPRAFAVPGLAGARGDWAAMPGTAGGETAITADVHVHAHSIAPESDIRFRPGRNGNHYLTRVSRPPHAPAVGVALVVAAAFVFVYGAVGYLRRRSAPLRPVVGLEVDGGLA